MSQTNSHNSDTSSIIAEVKAFYERYIRLYNDGKVKEYCSCFEDEGSITSSDSFAVLSRTEVEKLEHDQRTRFAAKGWDHTSVANSHIWLIEPTLALIASDLSRIDKTGKEFECGRCLYVTTKQSGEWKIRNVVTTTAALSTSDGLV